MGLHSSLWTRAWEGQRTAHDGTEQEAGACGLWDDSAEETGAPVWLHLPVSTGSPWPLVLCPCLVYFEGFCESQMTCELILRGSNGYINGRCHYSVRNMLLGLCSDTLEFKRKNCSNCSQIHYYVMFYAWPHCYVPDTEAF